ncbi:MAG: hypothetical protein JNJ54_36390 [Myxococcaceae bacterium]|nr:hypothetical protein [Myxococcaceae bacterium]
MGTSTALSGDCVGSANFQVKTVEGQLRIELFGKLTGATVRELLTRVQADLKAATEVVVVTIGLTDCSEEARPELVKLQLAVAAVKKRSAWVDDRSQFRGIALWVMHLADDQAAKATATMDQAVKWLSSSESREAFAARRATEKLS